jgi:hypothetical protein
MTCRDHEAEPSEYVCCGAALEQGDLAEFNQCLAVLQELYAEGVSTNAIMTFPSIAVLGVALARGGDCLWDMTFTHNNSALPAVSAHHAHPTAVRCIVPLELFAAVP